MLDTCQGQTILFIVDFAVPIGVRLNIFWLAKKSNGFVNAWRRGSQEAGRLLKTTAFSCNLAKDYALKDYPSDPGILESSNPLYLYYRTISGLKLMS